jgi:hypothetical protein
MRAAGLALTIGLAACTPAPKAAPHLSAQAYARWALLPASSVTGPGQFSLAGTPATCRATATVVNPHLDDTAAAYSGFIVVNPGRLAGLAPVVQHWAYAHECGHIRFGADEARADCAAVEDGLVQGWLTPAGLDQVCGYVRPAKSDLRHARGEARCEAMRTCFAAAGGSTAPIQP